MEKTLKFARFTFRSFNPLSFSEIRWGSSTVIRTDTYGSESFAAVSPGLTSLGNDEKGNNKSPRNNDSWMFSRDNSQRLQGFERVKQWYRNHYKRFETKPLPKKSILSDVIEDKRIMKHRVEKFSKAKYTINCSQFIKKETQLSRETPRGISKNNTILFSKTNEFNEEEQNDKKNNNTLNPQSKPILRVLPVEVTTPLAYDTNQEISENINQEPTTECEMQENKNILSEINDLNKNSVEISTVQAIEVNTIPSWLEHYELSEFYKKFDRLKEYERADNKYLKKKRSRKALPVIFQNIRQRPVFRGY